MGDFGLAIETYPEDAGNLRRCKGVSGTTGYLAPEQLQLADEPLRAPLQQLLAHTNVWGVGRIMWDMVYHSPSFQRAMEPRYRADGTCELDIRDAVRGIYSPQLLSNIGVCMHASPMSRLTFTELRRRIDSVISAPPPPADGAIDSTLQSYMHAAVMVPSQRMKHMSCMVFRTRDISCTWPSRI